MSSRKRGLALALAIPIVLAAGVVLLGRYKLLHEEPQPEWISATPETRFKYGSIGAEYQAGIPYWIFYVLPRMFPEKLPGPGGYASLGFAWEQGQELPIGFTQRVIGFPRVANNCAACHTARYRKSLQENPTFIPTGPNHTLNLEAFFSFMADCAADPRFNADNLLREIALVTKLSMLDRILYRYFIIPATKRRLLERYRAFGMLDRPHLTNWGRGRDEPVARIRYLIMGRSEDHGIDPSPTDIPAVWNIQKYDPKKEMLLDCTGDTRDVHSAIIDCALGLLGGAPQRKRDFLQEVAWLEQYLGQAQAPKYPFVIDQSKATLGESVFDQNCASCHASQRTGRIVPVAEVATDRERLKSWSRRLAAQANEVIHHVGIERAGYVETDPIGYVAPFLDGIWLRAPYLHNGSVPALRDLLNPAAQRPKTFYRGYDVYDSLNVGFISQGTEAQRAGTLFDVQKLGNSNQGHEFGTTLPSDEKEALIEYLKTL